MKKIALLALLASVSAIGLARAQTVPVPYLSNTTPTDAIQDVPRGVPGANSYYVTPGQIAGVPGYVNGGVVATAFTYTFGNSVTDYFVQPAGTLATGTLTTAANPSDGQRECFLSTQTQTALTWTANTGQTIGTVHTSATAYAPNCITYQASTATWNASP